jgi:hypothetical protein
MALSKIDHARPVVGVNRGPVPRRRRKRRAFECKRDIAAARGHSALLSGEGSWRLHGFYAERGPDGVRSGTTALNIVEGLA